MKRASGHLFPPEGFSYQHEIVTPEEEAELTARIAALALREFEFHGYLGKRRVISFGRRYDFSDAELYDADELPEFLLPVRKRAADFAGVLPDDLKHTLVTEYTPGTTIGWHRDKAVFDRVIGISLLSPCTFRFRRKAAAAKWERYSQMLEPRSIYLIDGEARTDWEHSIPAVESLRYSITFRTLR